MWPSGWRRSSVPRGCGWSWRIAILFIPALPPWARRARPSPRAERQRSFQQREPMIGMVLVTHGRLASEFVAALEHVVGAQAQIAAVCIGPDDYMEERRQEILRCIADVDSGDGAVVLSDMFGGTPSNLAISLMDRGKIEVIAGVNLP